MQNDKTPPLTPAELARQLHLMGLTDREVSKRLGCSTSCVNRIRRGENEPKWGVYDGLKRLHQERLAYVRKELGL